MRNSLWHPRMWLMETIEANFPSKEKGSCVSLKHPEKTPPIVSIKSTTTLKKTKQTSDCTIIMWDPRLVFLVAPSRRMLHGLETREKMKPLPASDRWNTSSCIFGRSRADGAYSTTRNIMNLHLKQAKRTKARRNGELVSWFMVTYCRLCKNNPRPCPKVEMEFQPFVLEETSEQWWRNTSNK